MSTLVGADDLKRALKAAAEAGKPQLKDWADEAVSIGRRSVPVDTGRLMTSIERGRARQRAAVVKAHYSAFFVDAGVKPHSLRPRNQRAKNKTVRTIFDRLTTQHPGYKARPFRQHMADEALRRQPLDDAIIDAWNKAL